MRFFSLLDFQYAILAYLLGIVGVILVYLAWGSYPSRRHAVTKEELERLEGHEIDPGHKTEHNPIAPFLIFIYATIIIWSISYGIFVGVFQGDVRAMW